MRWVPIVCLLLSACYAPPRYVANPYPPPPPPRAETQPLPPVSEEVLTWQRGHWDFDGSGYRWLPGRYVDRHGLRTPFQDGYWTNARGPWEWVPPHWL